MSDVLLDGVVLYMIVDHNSSGCRVPFFYTTNQYFSPLNKAAMNHQNILEASTLFDLFDQKQVFSLFFFLLKNLMYIPMHIRRWLSEAEKIRWNMAIAWMAFAMEQPAGDMIVAEASVRFQLLWFRV